MDNFVLAKYFKATRAAWTSDILWYSKIIISLKNSTWLYAISLNVFNKVNSVSEVNLMIPHSLPEPGYDQITSFHWIMLLFKPNSKLVPLRLYSLSMMISMMIVKSERSLYTEPSLKGNGRSWISLIHLSQKCTLMHIFLFLDITICDSKGDPDSLFSPRRHLGRKMMMVPDAPGGLEYLVWLRPNAHCLKIPVMPPTPITRTKGDLSHKKWQILSHYILSDKIQTHVSDPVHPFSFCIQVILSGYYEIFLWTWMSLSFQCFIS